LLFLVFLFFFIHDFLPPCSNYQFSSKALPRIIDMAAQVPVQ
jgi:hypothetical protein